MSSVAFESSSTVPSPAATSAGEGGPGAPRRNWMDRHGHRLGPLLILVCAVVVIVNSLSLRIGSLAEPGPGFWPIVAGVVTAAFALVELIVGKEEVEHFTHRGVSRVLILMASLLLIPITYEYIGFIIPTTVVVFIMMTALSKQRWWVSLISGLVMSGVGYYLFAELLQVRLNAF
ncbi:tripartite tricarboxylate transporter TctB family protein [Citricoccus sp. I39-566]|uniref:tripartite tricarboxylate transporter TctB family protein n=1 Tax=Citricoccus sp. I39-566 TaxID=3073268 RepID=UPI00286B68E9|nr:tripartite tricarboxylate transporter TctB family protein [Citricoccus sp. I39-566]WMY78556.1 tripartite tricarboxylate transporter TctB family protein [Citricoccus sp. I39-566]